jgi:hypothetical protein
MIRVTHPLPGGGFVALGKGGRAWCEASAKRADPGGENIVALRVSALLESAREMYEEAQGWCDPKGDGKRFELSDIVRLDGVRDFDGVHHVGELCDGLAVVPRDVRHKVRRFADPQRNRAESVRVGPKAWGGTIYDKHAETDGAAPVGRVRYEVRTHGVQLASQWAKEQGCAMRQVGDVTDEKVARLTRGTFDRLRFGQEVTGRASVAAAVFGCEWLTAMERNQLWAFLTAPGVSSSMSKPTRLKYRAVSARLGVSMCDAVEEAAPVLVRLDYDQGTEVLRVA